ncbi:hypothetical protein [Terrabacter sp. NPDC080008]|uniref:hypothetical protein n=1 Tax=Terrabacter sp. NPDC080008 TaxID=3155176 RepID=UPI00344C062F
MSDTPARTPDASTGARTPDPREHDLALLFRQAGTALDADPERVRPRVRAHTPTRAGRRAAPWAAAAAAGIVAIGAVGAATSWLGHSNSVTAAAPTTSSSASPDAQVSTPARVTSDAGRTTTTGPSPFRLTPGMPLPAAQRRADYVPVSSDLRLRGQVLGLATVHVQGKPYHLLLVPGRALPGHEIDGRLPQGACLVWLPATASLNGTSASNHQAGACNQLPAPGAQGHRALGGAGLLDPGTNDIDELRDQSVALVMTTTEVATVQLRQSGRTLALPHRLIIPGLDGAIFLGVQPYIPENKASQAQFIGLDRTGTEVFRF